MAENTQADLEQSERAGLGRRLRESAFLGSAQAKIGLVLGFIILSAIVVGPFFAPYDPIMGGVGPPGSGPSSEFLLGTDTLGRDVLSRVLDGGSGIVLIPLLAVAIATVIAVPLGISAAYRGGRFETIVVAVLDVMLTVPSLLVVFLLIAALGSSEVVLISSIAAVYIPRIARVTRGSARIVAGQDFVAAARARGERALSIIVREITPNIAAPTIAEISLRFTYAVLFIASLNFLGLGVQPPDPDWGVMINENRGLLALNPSATFVPAIGIALVAVSAGLLSDAISRTVGRDQGGTLFI